MGKRIFQRVCSTYALLFFCTTSSLAAADTQFDFAGFASFVASKVTTGDSQGNFDGMQRSAEMRDLSLLGLRAGATVDRLSFAAQAVMYGKDDFKPKFDWAYAAYDLGQGWEISAGRTRTPLFMYSAYQDVSYAYTWLKAPFAVYGIPQFKSVDGIKFRHQTSFYGWGSDLQMWYGTVEERLVENGLDSSLKLKDNVGVAWDVEHDWLRLHATYMYGKSSIDITSNNDMKGIMNLFSLTEQFYAAADPSLYAAVSDLKKQMLWEGVRTHFVGLGVGFDFNYLFIDAEVTHINIGENMVAPKNMQSAYITLGTRIVPKWTFAATFTRDRDREHKSLIKDYKNTIDEQILPSLRQFAQNGSTDAQDLRDGFLNNDLDGEGAAAIITQLQHYNAQGLTLTARWDFHHAASAKVEYVALEHKDGYHGTTTRPQALRVGIDLVF